MFWTVSDKNRIYPKLPHPGPVIRDYRCPFDHVFFTSGLLTKLVYAFSIS